METDPKGQLGGLETSDAVRRRLATESQSFKCATCGKTNLEIMQECEEAARASTSAKAEVEIPAELKMGWKDDMEKHAAENAALATTLREGGNEDAESAELAEGFVQTAPLVSPQPQPAIASSATTSVPASINVGQGAAVQPRPAQPAVRQANTRPPQTASAGDGVPLWVDRTIVILVVLLAAMLLKVLITFLNDI